MNRLVKNWITSLMGVAIMGVDLFFFFGHKYGIVETEIGLIEFVTLLVLGYVFLMAKDSLITGLFMGIFKSKAKGDDKEVSKKE